MIIRYFAEIKQNIVQRVIVVESAEYAHNLFGGEWVETFRDNPDKNYAGKGYIYVPYLQNFHPPKPYPNWELNEKLKWKPLSTDENVYIIPSEINKPKFIITEDDLTYKWDNELCKWINV